MVLIYQVWGPVETTWNRTIHKMTVSVYAPSCFEGMCSSELPGFVEDDSRPPCGANCELAKRAKGCKRGGLVSVAPPPSVCRTLLNLTSWVCGTHPFFSELIDSGLVGSSDCEGCRESRRCSRDTFPESNITKCTSIRRNGEHGPAEFEKPNRTESPCAQIK